MPQGLGTSEFPVHCLAITLLIGFSCTQRLATADETEWSVHDWIAAAGELETITQSQRDLPVVAEADVVVAGGGVAGVTAALLAAEEGKSVILIEPRNYFGYELSSTYRCDAVGDAPPPSLTLARQLAAELTSERAITDEGLDPLRLRIFLHQKIAAHPRIETFLFALPTGVVVADGRVRGVVFASHNGRQAVLARAVVDATAEARLAGAAGARFLQTLDAVTTGRRFARITRRTGKPLIGPQSVPSDLGLLGDQFIAHPGFLEWSVKAPSIGPSPAADLSKLHALAAAAGYALMDHLQQQGVEIPLELSPETYFDEMPAVACRERLGSVDLDRLDFTPSRGVIPDGVEGLVVAGRTVHADPRWHSLQGLLSVGELAGRAAVELANSAGTLPEPAVEAADLPTAEQDLDVGELLDGIEPGVDYPVIRQQAESLPIRGRHDVVVVGGGTSGVIAAITAAREGADVALVEVLPNLGGTSSNQVNGYYWGVPWKSLLRLELGDRIELIKRSDAGSLEKVRFSGPLKIRTLLEMAMDAGVNLYFQSFGAGAIVEGNRVRGVVVENAAGRQALLAEVVIDGTGHADIAVAAGAGWSKGRPTDGFMHEVSQRALRDPTHVRDISAAYLKAPMSAVVMGVRESRRVEGDYVVRFDEVLREELFPDTVARWRSNYDTHFPNSPNQTDQAQDWTVILGLWRRPIMGSIPYRSLLPKGLDGILVAGKAYSTDHDALVGGRMQPDMEHLGETVGVAAAMAAASRVLPRELAVGSLQRELVVRGVIRDQDVPDQQLTEGPPLDYLRRQDLWGPERAEQFPYPWGDAPAEESTLQGLVDRLGGGDESLEAMVQLYLAGEEALPLVRPLLQSNLPAVREEAAVLLGLQGDRRSIPLLLEFLRQRNLRTFHYTLPQASSRESVPLYWTAVILLGRMGERDAVPEMLELLQLPPAPEHYHLLRRREWADNMVAGVDQCGPLLANFLIVALGRIGDPQAADAIRPFLDVSKEVDLSGENLNHDLAWGIPTNAAWALSKLGDSTGLPVLIGFLEADQSLLRSHAHRLLTEITGQSLGRDPQAWQDWWRSIE